MKARNDPAREADALWHLGLLEWRAGNWELADRYMADSLDLQHAARRSRCRRPSFPLP